MDSTDGFPRYRSDGSQQQHGVRECSDDRRAPEAVRVDEGGRSSGEDRRSPGHPETKHVTEVVRCVREKRRRVGKHAEH